MGDTPLHLHMAVGAQKHALRSLSTGRRDSHGMTILGQVEALPPRVHMVELKCGNRAVVPAEHATPSGLFDQESLHLPASLGDGILATLATAPVSSGIEDELDVPMVPAPPDRPRIADSESLSRVARTHLSWGGQPVLLNPVTDRVDADGKSAGNLAERQAFGHQRLEGASPQPLARPVLGCSVGDQPMSPYPVPDCPDRPPDDPTDLRQGHAVRQAPLELSPLDHRPMLALDSDGKANVCTPHYTAFRSASSNPSTSSAVVSQEQSQRTTSRSSSQT